MGRKSLYNTTAAFKPCQTSVLADAVGALRTCVWRVLGISVLLLVPCFWHKHLETCDLGSHLYNTWLAQLVGQGRLPGLWLSGQWTNTLFDWMLSGEAAWFGFWAAERIATATSILIFFWGSFALIAAATRKVPWLLVPAIAAVTFGYTFEMGFFNFYLALGISFFGLALWWRGNAWERFLALLLVGPMLVAHPLGVIWFVGAGAYVALGRALPLQFHALLVILGQITLLCAGFYLGHHYLVEAPPPPLYLYNGADQLFLYGNRYRALSLVYAGFVVAALTIEFFGERGREFVRSCSIPLGLYAILLLAIPLLPRGVTFGPHIAQITYLTDRLTSISAILALCVLGSVRLTKWHFGGLLALAAVFFIFLYQDTATASSIETKVEALVSTLPPYQRVLATLLTSPDSRIYMGGLIDRACIDRCFSYSDYEPSSAVFRVRANSENPFVIGSYAEATSAKVGYYIVKPSDLPAYQIYQCGKTGTEVCLESLYAGIRNDRDGIHPR